LIGMESLRDSSQADIALVRDEALIHRARSFEQSGIEGLIDDVASAMTRG